MHVLAVTRDELLLIKTFDSLGEATQKYASGRCGGCLDEALSTTFPRSTTLHSSFKLADAHEQDTRAGHKRCRRRSIEARVLVVLPADNGSPTYGKL